MNEEKKINETLRHARMEHGWTQKDLASQLGVAESTVRSWEQRKRSPGPELSVRLSHVLGKSLDELDLLQVIDPIEIEEKQSLHLEENLPSVSLSSSVQEHWWAAEYSSVGAIEQSPLFVFPPRDENRQRMIHRVQARWISGFFDQLFSHNDKLMELHLRFLPNAVANPWRAKTQEPIHIQLGKPSFPDIFIRNAYDQADGELLILGEPGAGKTTLLLELTRDLLERCRIDEAFPIPVIFNLSSWAERRVPLADWLIEELHVSYQVPVQLARVWITNDYVFPLLDGLDEVALPARPACISAINAYRQEHGLVPMVICCRTSDYIALPERLILNTAVEIQPLTLQQIDTYIMNQKSLSAVRVALQTDEKLQEVLRTPLMLNILAYNTQCLLPEEVEVQARNFSLVFERYIDRLLLRPSKQRYAPKQAKNWLSWLALQMQKHNQTEFHVERLQPDWLETRYNHYRNTVIRIVYGMSSLLVSGLYACFRSDSVPTQPGLFYWLGGKGLGNTILGWMAPGLGQALRGGTSLGLIVFLVSLIVALIVSRRKFVITRSIVQSGLITGIRYGVISGIFLGLFAGIVYGITGGMSVGFYRGSGDGISEGVILGMLVAVAKIASSAHDSGAKYKYAPHFGERVVSYLIYVFCGALGMASIYSLQSGGISFSILLLGLMMGVGSGLVYSIANFAEYLYPGMMGLIIEPTERLTWSWEAVRKGVVANLMKGISLMLMVALPIMFVLGWASTIFHGPSYGVRYGLVYGSIVGVTSGVAAILTGILDSGSSRTTLEDKYLNTPNQGMQNSWRHACFAGGLFGGIGGVVAGATCGLAFWIGGVPGWFTLMLGFTLVLSLLFAFWSWMSYGGIAVIEHYVLRWFLMREGAMPAKYVAFLNTMVEHAVLYRVGGGYIFAHRLLLEHFAHEHVAQMKDHKGSANTHA